MRNVILQYFQPHYTPTGGQPKKSILKKTNSFTLKGFSPFLSTSPGSTPYTTVTGAESRIRSAFEAIFRWVQINISEIFSLKCYFYQAYLSFSKSAQLQDVDRGNSTQALSSSPSGEPKIIPTSPITSKKVQLVSKRLQLPNPLLFQHEIFQERVLFTS